MDSAHAMSCPLDCQPGRSHHAFHFLPTRKARLTSELTSEKVLVLIRCAEVGMGHMGEGEDRVRDHQSSLKAMPLGGVRGACSLLCCVCGHEALKA